jgi:hypothetical protein
MHWSIRSWYSPPGASVLLIMWLCGGAGYADEAKRCQIDGGSVLVIDTEGLGEFFVPGGCIAHVKVWGSGGGSSCFTSNEQSVEGGGGGFASVRMLELSPVNYFFSIGSGGGQGATLGPLGSGGNGHDEFRGGSGGTGGQSGYCSGGGGGSATVVWRGALESPPFLVAAGGGGAGGGVPSGGTPGRPGGGGGAIVGVGRADRSGGGAGSSLAGGGGAGFPFGGNGGAEAGEPGMGGQNFVFDGGDFRSRSAAFGNVPGNHNDPDKKECAACASARAGWGGGPQPLVWRGSGGGLVIVRFSEAPSDSDDAGALESPPDSGATEGDPAACGPAHADGGVERYEFVPGCSCSIDSFGATASALWGAAAGAFLLVLQRRRCRIHRL